MPFAGLFIASLAIKYIANGFKHMQIPDIGLAFTMAA